MTRASELADRLENYGLTDDADIVVQERRVVDEAAAMLRELDEALRPLIEAWRLYETFTDICNEDSCDADQLASIWAFLVAEGFSNADNWTRDFTNGYLLEKLMLELRDFMRARNPGGSDGKA